jgi:hypothetical protein
MSSSAPRISSLLAASTHRRQRFGFFSQGVLDSEMCRITHPPGPRKGTLQNRHLGSVGSIPKVRRPTRIALCVSSR